MCVRRDVPFTRTVTDYRDQPRQVQRHRQDCRPVQKRHCVNVTVPAADVVREPRTETVTVQVQCYNNIQGDEVIPGMYV
jgi:hypothetical protein